MDEPVQMFPLDAPCCESQRDHPVCGNRDVILNAFW